MKYAIDLENKTLLVTKEDSDPKFYSESTLLYHIKNLLNKDGYNLIKKLMWKDNHMVSDSQHYLRTRSKLCPAPHLYIWDGDYAIRLLTTDWNIRGHIWLNIETDVFNA